MRTRAPLSRTYKINLALFVGLMFVALWLFRMPTEFNVPFLMAGKYFGLPALAIALLIGFKFPEFITRELGPHYPSAPKPLRVTILVFIFCSAWLMQIMLASAAIIAINAYAGPEKPVIVSGSIQEVIPSKKLYYLVLPTETGVIRVPLDTCTAGGARIGDDVEIPLNLGRLGFLYRPVEPRRLGRLNAFYLENMKSARWARPFHVSTALEVKDPAWLESVAPKWRQDCAAGDQYSCYLLDEDARKASVAMCDTAS